jgi:hypothetical protein
MALEPTDQDEGWIATDIGLISEMSGAQERVIRSIAEGLGYPDLRSFRGYLADTHQTYYDMLRVLYGE